MKTAHRITNELNRHPRTIAELAQELGISRNSVHVQVSRLEAVGLIEQCPEKYSDGAGKPAARFRTVRGHEDAFSDAHKPVLNALMLVLGTDIDEPQRRQLLERAGSMLAQSSGLQPSGDAKRDVRQSVDAVNRLGAMAELHWEEQGGVIACHSCPVATLVHQEPLTCDMVAAFFAAASGLPVEVNCQRDGAVVCGFRVVSDQPADDQKT